MEPIKFDYSSYEAEWKKRRETAKERGLKNLTAFLEVARAEEITQAYVFFSGSGDSGAIDEVTMIVDGDSAFTGTAYTGRAEVAVEQERSFYLNGKYENQKLKEVMTLENALENIVYDLLEETNVDWYNNEGGFGEFTLNVVDGRYKLDVSVRYEHSESAYCADVDIATGEED